MKLLSRKIPVFGAMVAWHYIQLEHRMLRTSDQVVLISEDFGPFIQSWQVAPGLITVIPNWAELEKAPKGYKKLVQDIEAESFVPKDEFDLVVTKMMAEHLRNGRLFHKNIFSILRPGGVAIHYFPTLYALPFLLNRLLPERLSSFLVDIFVPRDRYQLGKFPAYYSWCYGPTPSMLGMLTEIGYEIILYKGFFGHTYYTRIPVLRDLYEFYNQYLLKHPIPYLTSFAQIVLHKPENARAPK
jgi:SAM-dependent methyltransferase